MRKLTMQVRRGRNLTLANVDMFCRPAQFEDMVEDVLDRIEGLPAASFQGQARPTYQQSFFKRPIATWVLSLFTLAMLYFAWWLIRNGIPPGKLGSVLMAWFGYLGYVANYRAARRK